jgi:alkanesulfonate monooxygenase SsuD/methylene tetrahydromethanopterin reductase-like flavin-dependent oxidoreductase (luciferase family)
MSAASIQPFAPGSVSLRLYPHGDLTAVRIVDELRAQAALAAEHGFDGVMTSEHHAGFHGYLPNPLQAAGWCLEAMPRGWAAPCPLLLPLRPPALVAEEIAWLAARFPGRVGLGVASGALPADFEIMHVPMDDLAARFTAAFEELAGILDGTAPGALAGDPAIAATVEHPIPVLSAAMGLTAARRAARLGAGLLFDSMSTPERCRELVDAFHVAGGTAPCVLVRRAWIGEPPRHDFENQLAVYRDYSSRAAQATWGEQEMVDSAGPEAVVVGLLDSLRRSGCDALNLRVHVPGVDPDAAREQIVRLGDHVLPPLRSEMAGHLGLI